MDWIKLSEKEPPLNIIFMGWDKEIKQPVILKNLKKHKSFFVSQFHGYHFLKDSITYWCEINSPEDNNVN